MLSYQIPYSKNAFAFISIAYIKIIILIYAIYVKMPKIIILGILT